MRRGQMPGAAAEEMRKEELHGASLVQATDTNKQDLPISHPSLPQAVTAPAAAGAGSGSHLFLG